MIEYFSYFENFNIIDWFVFMGSFIFIPAMYWLYLNYKRTKSNEFLIFGLFMLASFIHDFATPWWRLGPKSDLLIASSFLISGTAGFVLIYLHVVRTKWSKIPLILSVFILGIYFLDIGRVMLALFIPEFGGDLRLYFRVFFELNRIIIGAMMVYIYYTIKPILKTRRILILKVLWISFGTLMIFNGLVNITMVTGNLMSVNEGLRTFLVPIGLGDLITFASDPFLLLLTLYVCVSLSYSVLLMMLLFPETLLITEIQLVRATKLYSLIESDKKVVPFYQREDHILNYIKSLNEMKLIDLQKLQKE